MKSFRYVLITAARNEERSIGQTIKAVVTQSKLPELWVIVSDGSTDETDHIIARYTRQYTWMKLMRVRHDGKRNFSAKVSCFNKAYEKIQMIDYAIIGFLDADITFGEDYFAFLIEQFAANPRLGVAGTPFLESGRHYDYRFTNIEHVSGACQLFRRQCFEEIGGYVPSPVGGVDWIAVTSARMRGWQTRTFTERLSVHHRTMGTAGRSVCHAWFKQGIKENVLGSHPVWEVFRCFYQMRSRPYVIAGSLLFLGYLCSSFFAHERPVSDELVRFSREEQMQRLRRMFGLTRLPRLLHCCAILAAFVVIGVPLMKYWGIPLVGIEGAYSIGIWTGPSPVQLSAPVGVSNPVLRAEDVTDVPAKFVADPFMIRSGKAWYMFFEVLNRQTRQGDIGLAKSSDGLRWQYSRVVLDEPYHLSYPFVFESEQRYYMVPESRAAGSINLYRANKFPEKWTLLRSIVRGNFADPTILSHQGLWWLFASDRDDRLRLFWSRDLSGNWEEHKRSPLVDGNAHIARPAGRIVKWKGDLLRFTQDCYPAYGYQVRSFRITRLTTETYEETAENAAVVMKGSGAGWNRVAMHHVDAHEAWPKGPWIACVDGFTHYIRVGSGY